MKSTGKISLQEFANYLELPADGPVVDVFNYYDRVTNHLNLSTLNLLL